MQEVSGAQQNVLQYVIVRNQEDLKLFDVVAIGEPDDKGEHDVLFYSKDKLDFDDAVELMENLNKELDKE